MSTSNYGSRIESLAIFAITLKKCHPPKMKGTCTRTSSGLFLFLEISQPWDMYSKWHVKRRSPVVIANNCHQQQCTLIYFRKLLTLAQNMSVSLWSAVSPGYGWHVSNARRVHVMPSVISEATTP